MASRVVILLTPIRNQIVRFVFWLFLCLLLVLLSAITISGIVLYSLLHPSKIPFSSTPEAFQLPYETVRFPSDEGKLLLSGWLIPAPTEGKRLVIFAHGYGDHRSSIPATLPTAKMLHEQGFATLLFDFRNAGKSEGDRTTVGLDEQRDLLAAIDFAKAQGYDQIGLMGFSMGGAISIVTAAQSAYVKAVVVDSAFADLRPYLVDNLPVWSGLPSFFTPWILTMGQMYGLDPGQMRPIVAVQQLQVPLFLIHTQNDPAIPVQESVRLMKASDEDQEICLWLTPGESHVGSYEANQQEYLEKVGRFFEKHL